MRAVPVFESSRLIPAPPSEVFALVADGVRLQELGNETEGSPMRREVSVEHVGGPAAGPGATYEARVGLGGRDMGPETFVTDAYEPDRLVSYRAESSFDSVFELEPAKGGTLLTLRREYDQDPQGVVRRAASKLGVSEETVIPEIERELDRIRHELRGPGAVEETDEGGFRLATVVDAPPSAVFAHVADGRRQADWLDPTGERAEVEHVAGPPSGAGARYRLIRREGDDPPEVHEFSTVEFDAGRRVAYEFPGWAVEVFEVAAGSDGTRLSLERLPVANPRGLRARLARRAFSAERVVPEIERRLDAIRAALSS